MLARLILGPKEAEKEKRLNRQARRFDPQRRIDPLQRFAPSHGRFCQDPRHDLLHGGALIAPPKPLLVAPAMKLPMMAWRRQRGGRWGWVALYRPDGLPQVPRDAPNPPGLECLDPCGLRLSPRHQHGLNFLCRDARPERPWAARRCDDVWENVLSSDELHCPREGSGRRPSFHRNRPGGAHHHRARDSIDDDDDNRHHYPHHHNHHSHHHHHHRRHHPNPHSRHHLDPRTLGEDSQFPEWSGERSSTGPHRHHQGMEHFWPRPDHHTHRRDGNDGATIVDDDDDDDFYPSYDSSEEDDDDDVYSNVDNSTKSSSW